MNRGFSFLFIVAIGAAFTGCASRLNSKSRRGFDSIDKEGTGRVHALGITNDNGDTNELYLKTGGAEIVRTTPADNNGSLYDVKDTRSNLFTKNPHNEINDCFDVNVASNRMDPAAAAPPATAAAPGAAAAPAKDDIDGTLIKALPNLDPGKNAPVIIKRFKMCVVQRLPNGDVRATMYRESKNGEEAHALQILATVPGDLLRLRKDISTADLSDIVWNETNNGNVMQRQSENWEDEYTLRMSGYDEAKSKGAQELEEKRKQMSDVRDNLENRIKSFGNERKQLSKDRDDLGKKAADLDARQKAYENQINEQQKTIEEQKRQLDEKNAANQALIDSQNSQQANANQDPNVQQATKKAAPVTTARPQNTNTQAPAAR